MWSYGSYEKNYFFYIHGYIDFSKTMKTQKIFFKLLYTQVFYLLFNTD